MINIICSRSHFVINTVRALPLPPLKHICLFGCPSHRWWQDLVPDSLHRALSVFRALLAEALRFENVSFDRDVTNNSRCIECDTLRRVNRVNVRFSFTETSGWVSPLDLEPLVRLHLGFRIAAAYAWPSLQSLWPSYVRRSEVRRIQKNVGQPYALRIEGDDHVVRLP